MKTQKEQMDRIAPQRGSSPTQAPVSKVSRQVGWIRSTAVVRGIVALGLVGLLAVVALAALIFPAGIAVLQILGPIVLVALGFYFRRQARRRGA